MNISKRNIMFTAALFMLVQMFAQGPNNSGTYYQQADGKKGSALKTALWSVIKSHTVRSYDNLWDDFRTTDRRSDGKVWDMYSSTTNYTFGADQAGSYGKEGDVYNREHSFPKSWFNDASPMYTDLFHLVPTDGYVNGRRSNYPFGETNGEKYKSNGGFSKLGKCTVSGYSDIVFEPNDEYKGDFARIYFYMATCYEDKISGWNSDMLAHNKYPAYADWVVDMLLRWAKEDPVSQKEIDRNNAVYGIQHNRNPYVDYPGLEQYVWGTMTDMAFSYDNYVEPEGTPGPDPDPDPEPTPTGATYEKISSTDDLLTGYNYLIVYEQNGTDQSVAMGDQSGDIRGCAAVTAADGKVVIDDADAKNVHALTLEGTAGAYTLRDVNNGTYLSYSGSSNKLYSTASVTGDNERWDITFSGGNAMIENAAVSGRVIYYNVSSPRFACYKNAQAYVALYRSTTSTGLGSVTTDDAAQTVRVYSITGVMVRDGVQRNAALVGLPKGVYIIGDRKYVVR
ncbi:HNH endonuclease signature motif containing protein [Prevotella sp. HCN-7019]|uniref:HNH endonuclease signature motif containing protein n=1 Tax=Prevotella sp. HCN-7019 TaxID=3134668 RepID=UPI0030C4961B